MKRAHSIVLALCLLFIRGPYTTIAQSTVPTAAPAASVFDAVLADVEAAQVQLVNGRPAAFKARRFSNHQADYGMISRNDTHANPHHSCRPL